MRGIFFFLFLSITINSYNQNTFWGTTESGGAGQGVIFKTDVNGNFKSVEHIFNGISGSAGCYHSLCQSPNGKLYGLSIGGGTFNYGSIYEYNPISDTLIELFYFNGEETGKAPYGNLVMSDEGILYGMTCNGGSFDYGVIFKFDPINKVYTKIFDFNWSKGIHPYGSLFIAENGKLYGMTSAGGANNKGVLFEYDTYTEEYKIKVDFDGANKGKTPYGSLIEFNNKFYGLTKNGGIYNCGVLFEYDYINNIFIRKVSFDNYTMGKHPYGSLMKSSDDKLYGMTSLGGINNDGVLFQYNPLTSVFEKKVDFDAAITGYYPLGNLVEALNGSFYGMTSEGGVNNNGVLFEFNPIDNEISIMINFDETNLGNSPKGSLMEYSDGKLYGTTLYMGTLFAYDPITNNYIKKKTFSSSINGNSPVFGLLSSKNKKLYGMTNEGGINNFGVIYEYDPALKKYTKLFDFDGVNSGSHPYSGLIQADNGLLYGTAAGGGSYNFGVIFSFDIATNNFTKLYDFNDSTSGSYPIGKLTQIEGNKLYGITREGGLHGDGVIFEYNLSTNMFIKKFDFWDYSYGREPYNSMIQADNGKLYGTTLFGGSEDSGIIYEFDPITDIFSKVFDFPGENGQYPRSSLVKRSDGILYGLTSGGTYSFSETIYSLDVNTNTHTVLYTFSDEIDCKPISNLLLSDDNVLYGISFRSGLYNGGILYKYDIENDTLIKKFDFDYNNGANSVTGSLIEICEPSIDSLNITYCGTFTSPSGNNIWSISGNYVDTLVASTGCDSILFIDLYFYSSSEISVIACGNYTSPSGHYIWTESGIYVDTISNYLGCDSIITINLQFNSTSTIYENACNSYVSPSGNYIWNETGLYIDTIPNYLGCDSVININLSMYTSSVIFESACKEYFSPSGNYIWTESGIYNDTISNYLGCDSIITINLSINNSESIINEYACGYYISPSGNNIWTDPGIYNDTLLNSFGCDSIITINLYFSTYSYIRPQVCEFYISPSGNYTWFETGLYSDTIVNHLGCDSVISIELNVNKINVYATSEGPCLSANISGINYQWVDCNDAFSPILGHTSESFCPEFGGNYAVIVTENSCQDTSECIIFTSSFQVEKLDNNKILIFPNPSNGKFKVDLGYNKDYYEVSILDIYGEEIYKDQIINKQSTEIYFNSPAGIYFLKIESERTHDIIKIIKQ
ncbi:MAG: hypothetical protein A2W91_04960 [Bacteroidetes bacterium GWF2_38_335]|nr:MAG: hypothetical protein A2W91_04960 [Bacteroidetes bacterium GWF2_38_335]OFY79819.1 MAG: hypothetical protein A2281_10460 [Bacteroidetes bacterium RIFOXYA12_FULL_38_20]